VFILKSKFTVTLSYHSQSTSKQLRGKQDDIFSDAHESEAFR